MFDTLSRIVARAPRRTIAVWVLFAVACMALAVFGVRGETLFERLSTGQPTVPGSESDVALGLIEEQSASAEGLTLVVHGTDPTDPVVAGLMGGIRADLGAIPGVLTVIDPFLLPDGAANPAAAPLLAEDGHGFLIVVDLEPDLDREAERSTLDALETALRTVPDRLAVGGSDVTGQLGGTSLIITEITDQVGEDLTTGEIIALPIALLVMVMVFGGLLAAAMPMAGALASIAGGLGSVYLLSHVMDTDASVVNVVTVLGLGLSIDYGLLIVSRFREELSRVLADDGAPTGRRRRGDTAVEAALQRTLATAGRTVAFSAVTIAIAVCGLLVFNPPILRALGAGGAAVVLIAVATALTLVPALLRLTGRRLVRPGVIGRVPVLRTVLARTGDVTQSEGVFSRLAARVQRRPWLVLGGALLVLAFLASPVSHIELRNSTIELLPSGSDQRAFVEEIATQYPGSTSAPILVLAEATLEEVTAWSASLAGVPGVAATDQPAPLGSSVVIGVHPDADDPVGRQARDLVTELRSAPAPFPVWVTGQAAHQLDFTQALVDRAGWAIAIVVLGTLVLLFLMTGSVVVPVKALLTNAVSLSASLGLLVWAFQDGHLAGLLRFTSTGGIETYVVALVLAFGFGLAMDYEVFLLSRIKELYDAGHPNDEAVRLGLQRSGRIITSAAAIIIVVFTGFIFGELLVIKEVGFFLATAVFIDATLVRMLLVPATMTLLGRYNWWAPRFLRPAATRFAITH